MPEEKKPKIAKAAQSNNEIVSLINSTIDTTLRQTSVDPKSMDAPYNSDDLWKKRGNYDIYEEMLNDDQISVALQCKKDLVIGAGFEIEAEDSEDEEVAKSLQCAFNEDYEGSFEDALEEIISADEYGFSVTEKQFKTRDDGSLTLKRLKTRHPVSWLFHQDIYGNVVRYEQQGTIDQFTDIDPNSLIHYINKPRFGNPYGRSDLRSAYEAYFIKKQIIKYYAIFMEKAASPIPHGKYEPNATDEEITRVFNILKRFQASTALVYPQGFEIGFLESKGNGEVYTKGLQFFNMCIGRSLFVPDLLGFQGSETAGGSYALGEMQFDIFFKHIHRKRRSLENCINKHLVKPMVLWNFGDLERYPKFKLKPISKKSAVDGAKLWLEYTKGPGTTPTLAQINNLLRIAEFPEITEEEWQKMEADKLAKQEQEREMLMLKVSGNAAARGEPVDKLGKGLNGKGDTEQEEPEEKENGEKDTFAKIDENPEGDYHKKTDVKAIESQLDASLDLFNTKVKPLVSEAIDNFAADVKKKKINPDNLEKLESLKLRASDLKKIGKLLNETLLDMFDRSQVLAQKEVAADRFALTPEEFLKVLEDENFNFVGDWEYKITAAARAEMIAALKDGRPIAEVIDLWTAEGRKDSLVSLERYARTKHTEVMNKGRKAYFESTGVVAAYQFSAVLDGRTSAICRGLHGKIFKAGAEVTPPCHFGCRSLLIPITKFEDWKEDEKVGKEDIKDFIAKNRGKGF